MAVIIHGKQYCSHSFNGLLWAKDFSILYDKNCNTIIIMNYSYYEGEDDDKEEIKKRRYLRGSI